MKIFYFRVFGALPWQKTCKQFNSALKDY